MARINVGTVITHGQEKYEITEIIDKGGFGCVFKAVRTLPDLLEIAVKVPAEHVLNNSVWRKKFAREARILANISHRNVVKIIAFWEFADDEMALAQELIKDAKPILKYHQDNPDMLISLSLQTIYAMRAFHGSSTKHAAVHRDLSPRNILITPHGRVKVIDFGLAKEDPRITEVLTTFGEWFGTQGCMAPEQVTTAAAVDGRADYYAFGRTLAATIQNRNPLHAEPRDLSKPWNDLCQRLTQHAPEDRPATANEVLSLFFNAFAKHRLIPPDMIYHVREMRGTSVSGWPEFCWAFLNSLTDVSQTDLDTAAQIDTTIFANSKNSIALFDKIELSSALASLNSAYINFDDLDSLGELYVKLYPHLNATRKAACFRRVASLALKGHRYSLMQNVRSLYSAEPDQSIRTSLEDLLNDLDSAKVIEGRGIIPSR